MTAKVSFWLYSRSGIRAEQGQGLPEGFIQSKWGNEVASKKVKGDESIQQCKNNGDHQYDQNIPDGRRVGTGSELTAGEDEGSQEKKGQPSGSIIHPFKQVQQRKSSSTSTDSLYNG